MIYQQILVVSDSFIKGVIYLNAQGFFFFETWHIFIFITCLFL